MNNQLSNDEILKHLTTAWSYSFVDPKQDRQSFEISLSRPHERYTNEPGGPVYWSAFLALADQEGTLGLFAIDTASCDPSILPQLSEMVRIATAAACEDVLAHHNNEAPHLASIGEAEDWAGVVVFPIDPRDPRFVYGAFRFPTCWLAGGYADAVLLEKCGLVTASLSRPLALFANALRKRLNAFALESKPVFECKTSDSESAGLMVYHADMVAIVEKAAVLESTHDWRVH